MSAKISMETNFAWWVRHTLKKRNGVIEKVKPKYWLKTHKFKINVPYNTKQAIELDRENCNTLWWDAVCQEMNNGCTAFDTWEKPEGYIPPGYQ